MLRYNEDDAYPGTIYRASHCHDPFGNVVEVVSRSYEQQRSNRDLGVTRAGAKGYTRC